MGKLILTLALIFAIVGAVVFVFDMVMEIRAKRYKTAALFLILIIAYIAFIFLFYYPIWLAFMGNAIGGL